MGIASRNPRTVADSEVASGIHAFAAIVAPVPLEEGARARIQLPHGALAFGQTGATNIGTDNGLSGCRFDAQRRNRQFLIDQIGDRDLKPQRLTRTGRLNLKPERAGFSGEQARTRRQDQRAGDSERPSELSASVRPAGSDQVVRDRYAQPA